MKQDQANLTYYGIQIYGSFYFILKYIDHVNNVIQNYEK